MAYDTPILDEDTVKRLRSTIASFVIRDRLDRALVFRRYLDKVWRSSQLAPDYF